MAKRKGQSSASRKRAQQTTGISWLEKLKNNKHILKKIGLVAIILFATAAFAVAGVLISYLAAAPALDPAALEAVEASYIIDRDGHEIAQLHAIENRIVIPIDEIPEQLQKAFIAIEDERFKKHRGVDLLGFGRAILVNIRDRSFSQGASTITQQLIRNVLLEQKKTIKRKVQEMWLALKLERIKSKEEILEMYLNRIYFGNGVYGVEAASLAYFDKSVGDLELAEAALLAGIVRSPEYYNPFENDEAATGRMKLVLGNMKRLNYISPEEYEGAVGTELEFAEPSTTAYPYPYFVDYVVHHELIEILENIPEFGSREEAYEAIYNGGLRIYTTMHTAYQKHLETVLNRATLYPATRSINISALSEAVKANNGQLPANYPNAYIDEENGILQPQSAMVLADPKSGEIWALGGGRDYSKNRNELLRYLSLRQPGSAIKPLLEYAPSFNEGLLGLGSVLDDAPLVGPQGWRPENFDGAFRGLVTVRRALAHSYNIPAIRTYTEHIGMQKGAEMAYQMGISTYDPRKAQPVPSWAIGSREVTALDMAQGYSVLANNGVKMKVHTVRRIENRSGETIFEQKVMPEQILSREAAFMTTSVLQDVVTSTTARGLSGLGRPLAAKTGTTDDARDIYLAAYAPNVVATFWMGYDIKDMGKISSGWSYSSGMIRELFREVFKTLPRENFAPQPSGVVRVEVCTKSGLLPNEHCREAETVTTDYFLKNQAPRLTCDKHVQIDICKESGLLAGEYCPSDQIEQITYFERPDYLVTDANWKRGAGRAPLDAEEKPPEEFCDLHKEFAGRFVYFSASTPRENEARLSWLYRGDTVKEYQLYRRLKSAESSEAELIIKLGSNEDSYTDKQLQGGASYIYTLYAINEQGARSQPMETEIKVKEASEHPGIPMRPGKPKNLESSWDGEKVTLTWQAADDRAEEFVIQRVGIESPLGTEIGRINAETNRLDYSFSDYFSKPGTYTYSIVAHNSAGSSLPSVKIVTIPKETGSNESGTYAGLFAAPLRRLLAACRSWVSLLF